MGTVIHIQIIQLPREALIKSLLPKPEAWSKSATLVYVALPRIPSTPQLEQETAIMVKSGQKVQTHYRGTLDDGTVFDDSYKRGEPIEFVVGAGQMIPGFDAAVLEMEPGERKTVHIPAAEAYGERRDEAIQTIPTDFIPNAEQLPVGQYIYMPLEDGQMARCKVLKVENGEASFDLNHELAGQNLTFEIELVKAE
jgi:FKBP-type peptidyl-prolyl cis-trans isomerase 2